MRLTKRVFLVGSGGLGFDLTDSCDAHVYLVDGGSEAALIDAGGGREPQAIISNIVAEGIPLERVRYLLLTHGHADHAGGASLLREALGLQVLAARDIADILRNGDERGISLDTARAAGVYPADYRFRACPVDGELREGQKVAVGDCELLVMETPGHAAGCLSFLMERDGQRYLFCGDAVFARGVVALQSNPDCDLGASIRSIERLSGLAVDVFLPGHLMISLQRGQQHIDAAMAVLRTGRLPANLTEGR